MLALRWREVDSNPRSPVGERVIFVFAKGKRATETTRGDLETDEHRKRDRGFESVFLQRRVECEPDLVIVGFVPIPNGDLATANFDLDSAKLTMPPA